MICFLLLTIVAKTQEIKYASVASCPFELEDRAEVKLPEVGFDHPKLSPDGKKMLISKGYKGVYVVDLENPKNVKTISEGEMDGFMMKWTGVGDGISFMRSSRKEGGDFKREYFKKDSFLKSISVHDVTDLTSPAKSLKSLDDNLIIQYDFKNKKLVANDGDRVWDVATKVGICLDIVISPDKTKVVFTSQGKEFVYATDGSGMVNELKAGLNKSWSPDGKYILYFRDEDKGGHTIVESDLYICKADGSEYWKLTDTPDVLEMRPHWSSKGNMITYLDAITGKIYVVNIHEKNHTK